MTEETQPTLREAIESSIEQHSEPEAPVVVTPEVAAEPVAAESKPGRTAGRPRDEQGKLLPGKPVKAAEPIATAEPEKPLDQKLPSEAIPAAPAVALPPIQRPSSWKKDMWPVWDKLNTGEPLTAQESRQVAEYNAQRETQFATGVSTYKQIADTAKPLMDAVAPFREDIQRTGMQEAQFVNKVLGDYKRLAHGSPQEKLHLAHNLLRECGIPMQALYDQNAQQQYLATPYQPPQQAAPVQQPQDIAALIEQTLSQREVKQTIESMAKDTTKYPFFNYVRSDMSQLLETGEATDLDDAYLKALDLPQHGMLSALPQQQQAAATQQQAAAHSQATVRAAKANTVSPRSATPASAAVPDGPKNVRDSLKAAIAQHVGGGRV